MAAAIFFGVVAVAVVGYLVWFSKLSPERQHEVRTKAEAQKEARRTSKKAQAGKVGYRQPISSVGKVGPGGLACPRCGGTQFTAKRSMKGKVAVTILAPKTQVRCVTCGAMYKRG